MRERSRIRFFPIAMAIPLMAGIAFLVPGSRPEVPGSGDWMTPAAAAAVGQTVRAGTSGPPAPPRRLSETGLYAADGSIDPRNLPFSPQYPLWTDGAAKSRWIRLPASARIDVTNVDAWRFPAGTILWKEFAFGGRKVETRMLWQPEPDAWVFAAYVWNDEQTDAVLAPEAGIPGVMEVAPGRRHSIPGVEDCNACHRSSPSVVLGFSALQLSDDRDPLAPHADPQRPGMVTLGALVDADRLDPPRPEFKRNPPRIRVADPVARAALGYLSGNCGNCHNATGPLASVGLVLLHDVAGEPGEVEPGVLTTSGDPGRYVIPGIAPDSCRRVSPGAPEQSALLYRMKSRRPSSQMPPLGTALPDSAAIRIVGQWIAGLHGTAKSSHPKAETGS